jgi:nicotinamide mononucleotide transporter PnuC
MLEALDYSALIINVLYTIYLARLKVWSWLLGIIGSVILLILFYMKGIHSLVLLQVVYVIFFSYGWYNWTTNGVSKDRNKVCWMKTKNYVLYAIYLVIACVLCIAFNKYTGSEDIYGSGILTGITLVAVVMTIQEFLDNWIVWIISDIYFMVIMYQQDLYGQVIQNFIFLLTAIYGFYYWHKNSSKIK